MPDSRWDPLFEDLEHQFASERELEHGALAGEAERARVASLALRDRLAGLAHGPRVAILDAAGTAHRMTVTGWGRDWIAGEAEDVRGVVLLRTDAIDEVRFPLEARSASLAGAVPDPLRDRMGVGFVLRMLARRRAVVALGTVRGARHTGTLARAGSDHVEITLHDLGSAANVAQGEAAVAIRAIAWIRTSDSSALEL